MANADTKGGLIPVRMASGSVYNGSSNLYHVPSGNSDPLFVGDPVTITGTSDTKGIPSVARSTASGAITGVIVGFRPETEKDPTGYLAASTEGYILVADDEGLLCEVQADAAIVAANIGLNASMTIADGDTTYRRSNVELAAASVAATATLPLQIVRAVEREDNDPFDAGGNGKFLVRLNNRTFGEEEAGT